jgi:trimeric autotransporter adhesin
VTTSSGADTINAGGGADAVDAGGGDDTIAAGAGNDTLQGGDGEDSLTLRGARADYVAVLTDGVVTLTDQRTGAASDGKDEVRGIERFVFADGVVTAGNLISPPDPEPEPDPTIRGTNGQDLITTGGAFQVINGGQQAIPGQGAPTNAKFDKIEAGAGDDTLDGGEGRDSMIGGGGDDTYYVNDADDTTAEAQDGGSDGVIASLSWTLDSHIESLKLTGSAANGSGNSLGNRITGNGGDNQLSGRGGDDVLLGDAGNDTLIGGEGADTMTGGSGDDSYAVDSQLDQIIETQDGGNETVFCSSNWQMSDNVEKAILEADAGDREIFGNAQANQIRGNAGKNLLAGDNGDDLLFGFGGDDLLDGQNGNDTMTGGNGNDSYYVDSADDQVIESSSTGEKDTVYSSVSWKLGSELENLRLQGRAAINGAGNADANGVTGNAGANVLSGGSGSDTLSGGGGKDVLAGGKGADVYLFGKASTKSMDSITYFSGIDTLAFRSSDYGVTEDSLKITMGKKASGDSAQFIYNASTGLLCFDADGSGAGAAIRVATLMNKAALSADDFLIL